MCVCVCVCVWFGYKGMKRIYIESSVPEDK